ncbi:MAG: hypothetical protein ACRCZH_01690, partial [Cetobacterium sp.]
GLFIASVGAIIESATLAFNPQPILKTPSTKSDYEALKQDWKMVGYSVKEGINEFKATQGFSSKAN